MELVASNGPKTLLPPTQLLGGVSSTLAAYNRIITTDIGA